MKWDKQTILTKTSKMMQYSQTVGIDVSKDHLDFAVYVNHQASYLGKVSNTPTSLNEFLESLSESYDLTNTLFCLETTGMYTYPFLMVSAEKGLKVWLESALEISQSLGLKRDKNDALDAQQIAEYAFRRQDKAKYYEPPSDLMEQMQALLKLRRRMLDNLKSLATPIKEARNFSNKSVQELMDKCSKSSIESIKSDLKQIEKELSNLLDQDATLKKNFELTASVVGVGKWTVYQILLTTQNFTKFDDPKKYASYCGVVPFAKSSGKKRGKGRISFFAHKGMKTCLHMSALSAIRHDQELKQYYEKKCKEGKAKLAVINAVRNKIILRIFAVIKSRQKYEKRTLQNLETS